MAFIAYCDPEDVPATHRVPDGDNILRIHAVHPETLSLHYALYRELMYGASPLSRVQREMIAVTVSGVNRCRYCILHHGVHAKALLQLKGLDATEAAALVTALGEDHQTAALAPTDRTILDYAARIACAPGDVGPEDIAALRAVNLDDRAIHDICAIASYFNFVNRMALGLGVELEARFLE